MFFKYKLHCDSRSLQWYYQVVIGCLLGFLNLVAVLIVKGKYGDEAPELSEATLHWKWQPTMILI